jgi:hypothetical protein
LDLTKIPGSPLLPPTAQDFDDAALAIQAFRRELKVREAALARTLKIAADVLADADSFGDAPLAPLAP